MKLFKFFIMFIAMHHCAAQWTGKTFATLFCPGILSSELQATKYCPEYAIRRTTDALITTSHNNTIFDGHQVWGCNFSEMVPYYKTQHNNLISINKIISKCAQHAAKKMNVLFGPYQIGIGSDPTHIQRIVNTYCNFHLDWSKLNFGQQSDILCLKNNYDSVCKDLIDTDLVGFGFSRGAATLFDYVALEYTAHIPFKALIFEACPMNVASFMSLPGLLFLEKTTSFKKDGICPEKLTKQFAEVCKRDNVPLLFICSKKDDVVPYEQTLKMCMALKLQGVNNMYLIVLQQARHNAYLFNETDKATYHQAIHRFYKKCGLSFIEYWASQEDKGELIQIS